MLPNLIVIGAAKAGTTSLHRYLDLHPEISMSEVKELHFFDGGSESNWQRGLAWYERQFPEATEVRGETTPAYTRYPFLPGVPERMAAVVPDAKLIYLVRDPIDRILSHYRFLRFSLHEPLDELEDTLRDYENAPRVAESRYAYQLDRYVPHFPLSRLLVLDFADLAGNRHAALHRIFGFLGVDADFTSPDFDVQHNESNGLHANGLGRMALRTLPRVVGRHGALLVRSRVPRPLIRPLMSAPTIPKVRVDPVLLDELRAFLHEDADRLRALTGQSFASWSV